MREPITIHGDARDLALLLAAVREMREDIKDLYPDRIEEIQRLKLLRQQLEHAEQHNFIKH